MTLELNETSFMHFLMKSILLFILFQTIQGCMETPQNNLETDLCFYQTDGTGPSKGVKLNINYPCTWKIRDNNKPGMVKQFFKPDSKFGFSLFINEVALDYKVNKADMESMLKELGTVLSVKEIKIIGKDAIETVAEGSFKSSMGTIYTKIKDYTFVHEGKAITFAFTTESEDKVEAERLFDENEKLFEKLVSDITLY